MGEHILSQQIIQQIGWMLVHFIWQAAAVAAFLAMLLWMLRKSTANLRYVFACLALGLMVVLPVVTFNMISVLPDYPTTDIAPVRGELVLNPEPVEEQPTAVKNVSSEVVPAEQVRPVLWKENLAEVLEPALPYVVAGWLVGVLALSVWHLGGWAQLQRLRCKMVSKVDSALHDRLKRLAQRLGINRSIQLVESALVQVPTVVGWLRPVILLPASALTGLSTDQLEAMLAHELAHIKRLDYLVNMLQTVAEILGFYHPAVWWVSRRIRIERENCCDDVAANLCGDKLSYAKALTVMEETRGARPTLAVAATGGRLSDRIRRLVGKDLEYGNRASWIPSLLVILLIAISIIPATSLLTARAQSSNELNQALLRAAENGDVDKVKSLITAGADVDTRNVVCDTPLHCATQPRERIGARIIRLLMAGGADLTVKNKDGRTPLDMAVIRSQNSSLHSPRNRLKN